MPNLNTVQYQELCDTLESLVDRNTLSVVLQALANVCDAKADHVEANWQDKALARNWTRMAKHFDRISAAGV